MESIGTLAGGVAHDFNNLIHAISGYAQLLLLDKDENDPDYQVLNEIEAATKRAAELTRQLLMFSRKITSQLNPTDLNAQVEKVKLILERTIPRMITIEHQLSNNLKMIQADENQIEQVLLNLAVNASHAMPEGGRLVFETGNTVLDESYCDTHLGAKPGEYVQLSVTDTGLGMTPETVNHIFEPFFTTKEVGKGTGLGLSIVYGIVKNHNGYITCGSEPGKGTTFKLYFPVMDSRLNNGPAEKLETMVELHGEETVLVVDDDTAVLNLAVNMLTRYGYTTLTATSGEEALRIYASDANRVDLVILDLNMPGMGGHKCLQRLLEMNAGLKVIVASGYSPNGSIKAILESGPHEFIGKPFQLKDMLKKVRVLLDRR
jgi:CheY-like chemotaxis protein